MTSGLLHYKKHKCTGFSPFYMYMVHGWHARTLTEVIAEDDVDMDVHVESHHQNDGLEEAAATECEIDVEINEVRQHIKKMQDRQRKEYQKKHAGKKCLLLETKYFYNQITGDKDEHEAIRASVVSSMSDVEPGMDENGTWGTDLEIQAAAKFFGIRIYVYSNQTWQIFNPNKSLVCTNMY